MDYRDWLTILKKEGMLIEVDEEVDWNLEAAAYSAMASRVEDGKGAVIFNNVKGFGKGKGRLMGNAYASSRRRPWQRSAMVLGMDKNTSWPDFREEFARRIEHPLKPMIVDAGDARCKENIMMGKDVNLFSFPWPFIHQVDGGRYGSVSVTQIVKDPDTGWVNWGNYRFMVVGKNRMVGLQVFGQHGPTIFYTKWEARGKECPFVYAIGGDPVILFASGLPLPAGVCEADYAGGLRQEPLPVVRAETSDLYVPAEAEIVIEGVILPKLRLDEGPVGEYTGYIHGRQPMPVYQVRCVTYRSNPIIAMSIEGVSFNDNMGIFSSITNTEFYRQLRNAGFPVKDVRSMAEASYGGLVISTDVPYEGYVQDLRNFLDSHKITIWGTSSIVVDSDVDISDEDMAPNLYQEMATKIDPKRDISRTENDVLTTPLNPSVDAKGRLTGVGAARVCWDCTTPYGWSEAEKVKAESAKSLFPKDLLDSAAKTYGDLKVE